MALTNQEILALQQMMAHQQGVSAMPFGIAEAAANAAAGINAGIGGQGLILGQNLAFPGVITVPVSWSQGQPAPPSEPLSTGMKVEDLIGWRIWRVTNSYLWSFSYDYAWMPGDVSEGDPGDHDHAGVWAFKDKRRAFQKAIESGVGYVWGSVRLWGQVVEHADGYRASKARIVSLDGCTRDITPKMMTDLCRLYRVPEIEVPAPVVREPSPVRLQAIQAYHMTQGTPPLVARIVPFGEQPPLMEAKLPHVFDATPWRVLGTIACMSAAVTALLTLFRP